MSKAPAEVFIASEVTEAPPFAGIIIPLKPRHSAVLAIDPKFLTSVTPSKITNFGSFPCSYNKGTKFSMSW